MMPSLSSSSRVFPRYAFWPLLCLLLVLGGCATGPSGAPSGQAQTGKASYYADHFHGRTTASGERFDRNAMTAAHRRLPFGTRVKVTNLSNQRSVTVRINDRGPFTGGRIVDLSPRAADRLGMLRSGTAPVRLEVMR